jgi:hypothetical protein
LFIVQSLACATSNLDIISLNIICMPSITGSFNTTVYIEIKICKWLLNGSFYDDTAETAAYSCKNMKGSWNLYSIEYITNQTNDQELFKKYMNLSSCGR